MTIKQATPDIRRDITRLDAKTVAKAARFQPAIFADVAGRRGAMHGRIRAISPDMKLAGPALTVEVRPGDNLMIHAAMTLAQPGDILVIDGKGDQSCALMGALMMTACKALKLGGVVVDAAVRDSLELHELGFPVFSAGTNPNGPTKNVPGRINWPISCGGVTVSPGDLVIADADGVVIVERDRVGSLLDEAEKKTAAEAARFDSIRRTEALRPPWLDAALRTAGVLKAEETL
jgi:4-hydroxy-4-methyl-2-oxoglutarate aldolase